MIDDLNNRKTAALRKALFGYVTALGKLKGRERIESRAAFDNVMAGLLNGPVILQLSRTEADAVRLFLAANQYHTCVMTGQKLGTEGVLDHDHRTGRCRAVLSRSANGLEGGRPVGRLAALPHATRAALLTAYHKQYGKGLSVLYPRNR